MMTRSEDSNIKLNTLLHVIQLAVLIGGGFYLYGQLTERVGQIDSRHTQQMIEMNSRLGRIETNWDQMLLRDRDRQPDR